MSRRKVIDSRPIDGDPRLVRWQRGFEETNRREERPDRE